MGLTINAGGNPVSVPPLHKLWAQQDGYAWSRNHDNPIPGWPAHWLVVAQEGANPWSPSPSAPRCVHGRARTHGGAGSREAMAVVQARVVKAQDLYEDASDPGSVAATRYAVRVQRTLRGRAPAAFALHSENTSARLTMDTAERYLLFVSSDASGRYFVDACSNSARLTEAWATLKALAASPNGK